MIERDRKDPASFPLAFTIPLPPVTKKNSQRILTGANGKPFVSPSQRYKDYERSAVWFCPRHTHIDQPVNIRCIFYMPDRRRCDLTNLLESIDDILVNAGTLEDDRYTIVAGHDGSRVRVDKERPRTEITITIMEE